MSLFFKPTRIDTNIIHVNPSLKQRTVFLDALPTYDFNLTKPSNKTKSNRNKLDDIEFPQIKEIVSTRYTPQDIVYNNSKPIYMILRIMGVFPLTRTKPGLIDCKFASPAVVYSVILFCGLFVYVVYVALNRINVVRSLEGRFEEAVIAYLFIVNILPIFMIPIVWHETKKVAEVLNNWTYFETLYFKTTGRPLPLHLIGKTVITSILLPILSAASVVITHFTMVGFSLLQVIPYIFLDTMIYVIGAYWYFACETLSESATILADDFQKALRHIGPAAMVAEYRALWLRLSKLARDTGTATCYTFTYINLYLFFIITLSIYGLMSQLSDGFGVKDVGLAVTAFCSIFLLFFICDEAHYASQHVRTNFQKKLLMVELSWMNTDAQTEINMFLRATEMNPSNINLGGFFDVNRSLFKSLLTTMVTYLVVLLQFQISLPEDPSLKIQNINSTNQNMSN